MYIDIDLLLRSQSKYVDVVNIFYIRMKAANDFNKHLILKNLEVI